MPHTPQSLIARLLDYVERYGAQNDEPKDGDWQEVVSAARDYIATPAGEAKADEALPTVVLEINGGVVNCARSTVPTRLIVLDEDTDGGERTSIREVFGEEMYVSDMLLTQVRERGFSGIAPDFVAEVIEAQGFH